MRSDWDITRKETGRSFFPDQPDLTEILRVQSTMTHRASERVVIREENFTTPSEADIVRSENRVLERIEKAMLETPLVVIGVVDTAVVDPRTDDEKKAEIIERALDAIKRIKDASAVIVASGEDLKADAPADAEVIDAATAKLLAIRDAAVTEAFATLKAAAR